MKKTARIGTIIKILSDSPSQLFSLKYFCDLLGAAKSTISEDISVAGEIIRDAGFGTVETMSGTKGGVRFLPSISDSDILNLQKELCGKLRDSRRLLGGGFLYTSDIMYDNKIISDAAKTFVRIFKDKPADFIATIETKGIPVAAMTAHLMNLPLVIVRREVKISEGSTVSINYFSGSYDRVQKMSLSKRSVAPGSRAIIIDDFMRGGGSIKGIMEILAEFDVKVSASGVIIAAKEPIVKKISDYVPLIFFNDSGVKNEEFFFEPNEKIINF